jgi:nucleoid-associated protein YgaU
MLMLILSLAVLRPVQTLAGDDGAAADASAWDDESPESLNSAMTHDLQGLVERMEQIEGRQSPQVSTGQGKAGQHAGLPEIGTRMPYFVRRGDTLGSIAAKVYGNDPAFITAISGPGSRPVTALQAGDVVYYKLTASSLSYTLSSLHQKKQTVKVNAGDSLFLLAARLMGEPLEWRLLWRFNDSIVHPDKIKPGTFVSF